MVRGRAANWRGNNCARVPDLGYDVTSIARSTEQKFVERVAAHVPAPQAEAIHGEACCLRASCFSPAMQPGAGPEGVPNVGSSTSFLKWSPRQADLQLQVQSICQVIVLSICETHHCVVSENTVRGKSVHGVYERADQCQVPESEQVLNAIRVLISATS